MESSSVVMVVVDQLWSFFNDFFGKSSRWTFQHFSLEWLAILQCSQKRLFCFEKKSFIILEFLLGFCVTPFGLFRGLLIVSIIYSLNHYRYIASSWNIICFKEAQLCMNLLWRSVVYFIIVEWSLREISSITACHQNSILYSCMN